jgi:hypothetical protein
MDRQLDDRMRELEGLHWWFRGPSQALLNRGLGCLFGLECGLLARTDPPFRVSILPIAGAVA